VLERPKRLDTTMPACVASWASDWRSYFKCKTGAAAIEDLGRGVEILCALFVR
jgi:hypothetical protein